MAKMEIRAAYMAAAQLRQLGMHKEAAEVIAAINN
jgi:hypothetical protein